MTKLIAVTSALYLLSASSIAIAETSKPTHDNLNSTLWYQTSAEFRANSIQTYRQAEFMLPTLLTDKKATALTNQTANYADLPPAIIVDIDETILDNSPSAAHEIKFNHGFDAKNWDRWVSLKQAKAVPGAVKFVNMAQQQGVKVLFISNRECKPRDQKSSCPQKDDTIANLKLVGIKQVDSNQVWLKSEQADWTSEKESRRILAANKFRVIMLMGDDFGDFLPNVKKNITPTQRLELVDKHEMYWGTRWFMLTNPTYGSWETILEQPKTKYLQSYE
jgi:5'-nucleotidase (lipoprotein e(P4) family)